MNSYGQAGQDIFVKSVMQNKCDGYFVEIGSNHPIQHNNTYMLENHFNWKGLMVEYDTSFEPLYKQYRPNSIYQMKDARTVNYRQILDDNNFPVNIDYLQIDLDVNNRSTLDTFLLFNNTVLDKYKFATITFEHAIYTGNYFDTQAISRKILIERGYILVFPDVSVFWEGNYKPFEDWYVHPDLVNMQQINAIKSDVSMTNDQIRELL
jgi:hypothetical protein